MNTASEIGIVDTFAVIDNEYAGMSKQRILKNLFVISLGFMLLFSAFQALANLQSTMNNAGSVGVISQSTIYAAMITSALFFPKMVIKKIGCKLSVVFASLTYTPYMAASLYPAMTTLLPTAVLLGVGASILWAASNTYINQLGFRYVKEDFGKSALSSSRFFGVFHMIFPTTQIWGNLVSFYVFRPTGGVSHNGSRLSSSHDRADLSCGAGFCGGLNQTWQAASEEQRSVLVGIYCALSLTSTGMFALFMDPLKQPAQKRNTKDDVLQKLSATFRQMKKTNQLLLIILTIFTGLEKGFLFSDFSKAYVACALNLESVGLVFVCYGIVSSVVAISVGHLVKYVPRPVFMIAAALVEAAVFLTLLFWEPDRQLVSYFVIVGFCGFSDAIWQTQLTALYGTLFRSDEEAAFSNCEIFRAIGYMIAFSWSSVLCTTWKIYGLFGFLIFGMAGYLMTER